MNPNLVSQPVGFSPVFDVVKKEMSFIFIYSSDRDAIWKKNRSLQEVVRMFQNWAHFEATYLPYIIPLKNHRWVLAPDQGANAKFWAAMQFSAHVKKLCNLSTTRCIRVKTSALLASPQKLYHSSKLISKKPKNDFKIQSCAVFTLGFPF